MIPLFVGPVWMPFCPYGRRQGVKGTYSVRRLLAVKRSWDDDLKALLWISHNAFEKGQETLSQWTARKQPARVKGCCASHRVWPGLITRRLCLLPYSLPPPSPRLLCLFLLSKGFLMTNLSGLTSLPISHCGIQLPAHPLMNSPGSKDRADRGEDWWKTQKSTSTPSFTFQDSTPPASSLDGSFPLFFSLPPFNVLCRSHLLTVRTT